MGAFFSPPPFCKYYYQIESSEPLGTQNLIERFYLLNKEGDDRAVEVLSRWQKAAWFHFTFPPSHILLKWHCPTEGNKGDFEMLPCAGPCGAETQQSFHSHLSSSEGSLSLCGKPLWSSHSFGVAECRDFSKKTLLFSFPVNEEFKFKRMCSLLLVFHMSINRTVPRLWPGVYSRFTELMRVELGYEIFHLFV